MCVGIDSMDKAYYDAGIVAVDCVDRGGIEMHDMHGYEWKDIYFFAWTAQLLE